MEPRQTRGALDTLYWENKCLVTLRYVWSTLYEERMFSNQRAYL